MLFLMTQLFFIEVGAMIANRKKKSTRLTSSGLSLLLERYGSRVVKEIFGRFQEWESNA
jgi:hypothetical protein